MSKPARPTYVSITIIAGGYVVTVGSGSRIVSRHAFEMIDAESARGSAATPGTLAKDLRRYPALAEAVADLDVLAIAHAFKSVGR
jgi:hypothetical protein